MPQSLQNITPQSLQKDIESNLLRLANKENLWQRFMLGDKIDENKFLFYSLMFKKFCPKNCTLYDYLWDKIKGKLKDKCPEPKEGFYTVKKVYSQVYNEKESEHVVNACSPNIEW